MPGKRREPKVSIDGIHPAELEWCLRGRVKALKRNEEDRIRSRVWLVGISRSRWQQINDEVVSMYGTDIHAVRVFGYED